MALPDNLADLARSFLGDASNQSLGASGYQKLPSGLLIQWGTVPITASGATASITMPVAFAAFYSAIAVPASVAGATPISLGIDAGTTLSTLKVNNHSGISKSGFWIAIGAY